jgi:hypothetical protein
MRANNMQTTANSSLARLLDANGAIYPRDTRQKQGQTCHFVFASAVVITKDLESRSLSWVKTGSYSRSCPRLRKVQNLFDAV